MIRALPVIAFMILLTGCMSLKIGAPPRVDNLALLTPGVSTKADLLMALGAPRGYGVARFSPETSPLKLWLYEYVEAEGKNISLKMLVVILSKAENEGDPEKYEGHLWFYSGNKLTNEYFGSGKGKK